MTQEIVRSVLAKALRWDFVSQDPNNEPAGERSSAYLTRDAPRWLQR
jgi:hypothetical protein